jgi:RNA polymerase-binding transcription factor DksA
MHPQIIAQPAHDKRHQCACDAVSDHAYGLCRQCQARIAWRRRATRTSRHVARRLAARQRLNAVYLLRAISKGVEN